MQGRDVEENVSVTKSIKTVLNMLKSHFLKQKIKINNDNKIGEDVMIKGSKSAFSRILINIIVNSIEELSHFDIDREISMSTFLQADKVYITIRGNGRGIPKDQIDKIFNEDFSLKSNGYSLGLGLPFVKKTVEEDFEGEIQVSSIRNKFTGFILTFKVSLENGETF